MHLPPTGVWLEQPTDIPGIKLSLQYARLYTHRYVPDKTLNWELDGEQLRVKMELKCNMEIPEPGFGNKPDACHYHMLQNRRLVFLDLPSIEEEVLYCLQT